jgi:hypothetical protein
MYGGKGMAPTGQGAGMTNTGMSAPKPPKGYKSVQNFTPDMMQLMQQLIGQLGPESFLGRIANGDQSVFEELEAPALKQFSGIQGNIASRFSAGGGGQGALSSRKSSGFQNAQNQAASDFSQQLQANRVGMRENAIKELQGAGNQLLQQQPYSLVEKQKPWWQEAATGFAQGAGQGATSWITGLLGL